MENTKIEWATHTFNPWEGCAKVSPGCKNCYANSQHQLHHSSLKAQQGTCWGVGAPRLGKSEDNWKKPLKWNREAQATGIRARVFCASMADVFEGQSAASRLFIGDTAQVPTGGGKTRTVRFVDIAVERLRLLRLIYDTPHLDWLLLTKRPENIVPALQDAKLAATRAGMAEIVDFHVPPFYRWLVEWANYKQVPANVWLGTSVENQEQADIRVPQLLAAPASVRFLSCEPLLSTVRLDGNEICPCGGFKGAIGTDSRGNEVEAPSCDDCDGSGWTGNRWLSSGDIDWVIVGGESGPHARPLHPLWATSLRDQCQAAGVAFHFKQWGEWAPAGNYTGPLYPRLQNRDSVCFDGSLDGSHAMSTDPAIGRVDIYRVGKHVAGRLLDGRTWDELPTKTEVRP